MNSLYISLYMCIYLYICIYKIDAWWHIYGHSLHVCRKGLICTQGVRWGNSQWIRPFSFPWPEKSVLNSQYQTLMALISSRKIWVLARTSQCYQCSILSCFVCARGFQRVCCVQNRLDPQCDGPVRILTLRQRRRQTPTLREGPIGCVEQTKSCFDCAVLGLIWVAFSCWYVGPCCSWTLGWTDSEINQTESPTHRSDHHDHHAVWWFQSWFWS
jgi:hypothetical protein